MRVLIVDDHPLFRKGLKALLFELDSAIVTVEAGTLGEMLAGGESAESIDLVLLDMHLPDGNGLDALQQVKQTFVAAPVVMMSAVEEPRLIRSAIDAGACGYIPKTTDPLIIVNALRLVLAHGTYLPPAALQDSVSGATAKEPNAPPLPGLSGRQLEVLQRLLLGKPNKIIAREMAIAEGTVKAHLAAVYQYLNVSTRTQAMYRAHELGMFQQFASLSNRKS